MIRCLCCAHLYMQYFFSQITCSCCQFQVEYQLLSHLPVTIHVQPRYDTQAKGARCLFYFNCTLSYTYIDGWQPRWQQNHTLHRPISNCSIHAQLIKWCSSLSHLISDTHTDMHTFIKKNVFYIYKYLQLSTFPCHTMQQTICVITLTDLVHSEHMQINNLCAHSLS